MKELTPCMAKKPNDPEVTCSLPLRHRGAHSWSWSRRINQPLQRPHDNTLSREETAKQRQCTYNFVMRKFRKVEQRPEVLIRNQ